MRAPSQATASGQDERSVSSSFFCSLSCFVFVPLSEIEFLPHLQHITTIPTSDRTSQSRSSAIAVRCSNIGALGQGARGNCYDA